MKNLPEDELFDALENRLKNYSESPDDDVWYKVSAILHIHQTPGWVIWSDRTAAAFALMALLFILYATNQESSDMNDLSFSSTLISKVPYVSEVTPAILPLETESPKKVEMPKRNVLVNEDSSRSKAHGFYHKSNQPSSLDFNNNDAGVSEVSSISAHSDLTVAQMVKISSDSLYVERIVKTDTVAKTLQNDTPKKEKKKSRLTMYAMITPMLSYNRVSPLSNDDVVVDRLNSPSIFSGSRLGISIEAGIQGKITTRLEYLAGISYYHQSQDITYDQLTSENVIIEEDGDKSYMVRPGVLQKSFAYDMQNIGIQTGLLYALKLDGLIHKAGVMINYQKGLRKSTDTEVYNNASSDYLSYQLLYRMEYRLKSGISVFIQPTYRHSLYNNESIQAPFSLKQSRAGIGVGVVYSF